MFSNITFDELNQMNSTIKSIPYEKYFGEMDLGKEEKEKRIELAKRFEREFLFVLIYLFTTQQYGVVNWKDIQNRFEKAYLSAINGVINTDDYIKQYAKQFSQEVTKSTKKNETDLYYYTTDRSIFIAENESNSSWEYQNYSDAIKLGKKKKQWKTMKDKYVRHTHKEVEGKTIDIDSIFLVGNSMFRYAKDTYFSPSGKEIIGCRCTTKYF